MNKTVSMSIRVLEKLKQAAQIESYSSYSEFIRRTVLLEAPRIISEEANPQKEGRWYEYFYNDGKNKENIC